MKYCRTEVSGAGGDHAWIQDVGMLATRFCWMKVICYPFDNIQSNMTSYLVYIVPVLLFYVAQSFFFHPLRQFRGPFIAKFTSWWRFVNVFKGNADVTDRKLHHKYGTAVRLGPNFISLSDPSLIKTIYRTRNPFLKSNMYRVNDIKAGPNLISTTFGTLDEKFHTRFDKPIRHLYTINGALKQESRMDSMLTEFCEEMEKSFVDKQTPCALHDWINYLLWDMTWNINFSKPLGCMANGGDFANMIATSEAGVAYFASVGQIPTLDQYLDKNPVWRIGPPSFGWGMQYSYKALGERAAKDMECRDAEGDFLDLFLQVQKNNPDVVTNDTITTYLASNIIAGSDSTAGAVAASIYFTLRHPDKLAKLQAELDKAMVGERGIPQWSETHKLPYLDAVIKEAMRLYPSVGLQLQRVVPAEGLTLPDGRHIPSGTVVGISPPVVNRDPGVFGHDAEHFRPERWFRDEEESGKDYEERISQMKRADLTFGYGKRMCLGRYLSLVEVYKTIATVFSKYDWKFENPEKEWTSVNNWFMYQKGLDVLATARKRD
jgi:cytochrome P450